MVMQTWTYIYVYTPTHTRLSLFLINRLEHPPDCVQAKGRAASLLATRAVVEEQEEEAVVFVMVAVVGLARTKLRVTCLRACISEGG